MASLRVHKLQCSGEEWRAQGLWECFSDNGSFFCGFDVYVQCKARLRINPDTWDVAPCHSKWRSKSVRPRDDDGDIDIEQAQDNEDDAKDNKWQYSTRAVTTHSDECKEAWQSDNRPPPKTSRWTHSVMVRHTAIQRMCRAVDEGTACRRAFEEECIQSDEVAVTFSNYRKGGPKTRLTRTKRKYCPKLPTTKSGIPTAITGSVWEMNKFSADKWRAAQLVRDWKDRFKKELPLDDLDLRRLDELCLDAERAADDAIDKRTYLHAVRRMHTPDTREGKGFLGHVGARSLLFATKDTLQVNFKSIHFFSFLFISFQFIFILFNSTHNCRSWRSHCTGLSMQPSRSCHISRGEPVRIAYRTNNA